MTTVSISNKIQQDTKEFEELMEQNKINIDSIREDNGYNYFIVNAEEDAVEKILWQTKFSWDIE